jgi:hypothetical protein
MHRLGPSHRRTFATLVCAFVLFCTVGWALLPSGCGRGFSGWYAQSSDFLETGRTLSFFTAIQVDPRSEDSAGPQFSAAGDLDGDGMLDLVSAWNQSQPIQIHLQRRGADGSIGFETVTLAGNVPVIRVAGLGVADVDLDGRLDIIVLVKQSLVSGAGCPAGGTPESQEAMAGLVVIYFGPADAASADRALAWEEVPIGVSLLAGVASGTALPEEGGYTALAIGDMNRDGALDIVTAWNGDCGQRPVLLFTNLGPLQARDGTWRVEVVPGSEGPEPIKDVALADLDRDGDLDVLLTRPAAQTMNVRWLRNPIVDVIDDVHISNGQWQVGPVGQMDTGADMLEVGDIDQDGLVDVVVRSTNGSLVQWFKAPPDPTTQPIRNIPWQVYTLGEFRERAPLAMALADLNGDGQLEVIASAGGALLWFDSLAAPSVYDQWTSRLIIDDDPPGLPQPSPTTTDPNVAPQEIAGNTMITSITIVDLDGDGRLDLIAPLDRTGLSGLSNDALVWFRNSR